MREINPRDAGNAPRGEPGAGNAFFFGGLEAAVKLIDEIVCLFMSPPLTTSALTRRQEAIDSYQER